MRGVDLHGVETGPAGSRRRPRVVVDDAGDLCPRQRPHGGFADGVDRRVRRAVRPVLLGHHDRPERRTTVQELHGKQSAGRVHRVAHPGERLDQRVVVDAGDVGGSPPLAGDEGAAGDDQADAAPGQLGGEVDEPLRGGAVEGGEALLGGASHEAVGNLERPQSPGAEDAADVALLRVVLRRGRHRASSCSRSSKWSARRGLRPARGEATVPYARARGARAGSFPAGKPAPRPAPGRPCSLRLPW